MIVYLGGAPYSRSVERREVDDAQLALRRCPEIQTLEGVWATPEIIGLGDLDIKGAVRLKHLLIDAACGGGEPFRGGRLTEPEAASTCVSNTG